jgi:NAD(P)-dependent dehydrogenase (short-subunit alcohol dehydrogenase family)
MRGAGRGIGREIALDQARSGAKVAVQARTADEINETASLIGGEGGVAVSLPVDLVDRRVVEHVVDRVASELGSSGQEIRSISRPSFTAIVTLSQFKRNGLTNSPIEKSEFIA